jgi:hypothetical protein
MAKISIDDALWERVRKAAAALGYSSPEEFVAHCIDNELKRSKVEEAEEVVAKQLRGLGYIE